MSRGVPAGVAAGHEATAAVGHEVLAAGGNAADAACAMVLAGCVAETIYTGLGGGGFAVYFDAATGNVTCHDFFVAVPGLDGSPIIRGAGISVSFGGVPMPYDVGGPTVAVPGTPTGVEQVHRQHGSIAWHRIVEPAIRLARTGIPFSQAHADLLPEVQQAFLIGAGIAVYSRAAASERRLLQAQEMLFHDGLARTLEAYATEGAEHLMRGDFAHQLVTLTRAEGGALSLQDLADYRPVTSSPRVVEFGPTRVHLRADDLDDMGGTLLALDLDAVASGPVERAVALANALDAPARRSDTTALVAIDPDGNACVCSHSLGLGSGVWLHGVHANSMLGEGELLRGVLRPGARMGSMMTPLVATGADGELLLGAASAGGSRIRSALLQVLTAVLVEGSTVPDAVAAPRLALGSGTVHLEPGFAAEAGPALELAGYRVNPWADVKPYFGGVAAAGRTGLAADPRRSGQAVPL